VRNRLNIVVLGSLLASLILVTVAAASGPVHWSYEGEAGPEHWGELSHDFAACSEGKEQSPIDVPGTATVNPADLTFNYQPTAVNILNNGHTIQVNYDVGSSLEVDGTTYNLLQLHFHATSEHTVGGKYSDMEMHLVHQSADGGYAVVGVMINRGAENAAFAPVWNNRAGRGSGSTDRRRRECQRQRFAAGRPDILPVQRFIHHAAVYRGREVVLDEQSGRTLGRPDCLF